MERNSRERISMVIIIFAFIIALLAVNFPMAASLIMH